MRTAKIKRFYSLAEYATKIGKTKMGALYQINKKKLPKGISARKVGNAYVITDNSDKFAPKEDSQV